MTPEHDDTRSMLDQLAAALERQQPSEPQLPPASDQDIFRALVGKSWRIDPSETTPARKAG